MPEVASAQRRTAAEDRTPATPQSLAVVTRQQMGTAERAWKLKRESGIEIKEVGGGNPHPLFSAVLQTPYTISSLVII